MTLLRALWVLTIAGFVVPNVMVIAYLAGHDLDVAGYFGAWWASLPSTQLLVDLGIVSVTFAAWTWVDSRRRSLAWWYVIPATCAIGICFAVPLYLLRREMAGTAHRALRTFRTRPGGTASVR